MRATVEDASKPFAYSVSVRLNTNPVSCHRFWFPKSKIFNDGQGNLFAPKWLIEKKNEDLRDQGESASILLDYSQGFWSD